MQHPPLLPAPLGDCVTIGKSAVIPAQAGIQVLKLLNFAADWMPASTGMTNYDTVFHQTIDPGQRIFIVFFRIDNFRNHVVRCLQFLRFYCETVKPVTSLQISWTLNFASALHLFLANAQKRIGCWDIYRTQKTLTSPSTVFKSPSPATSSALWVFARAAPASDFPPGRWRDEDAQ